jgi:hypothetical protein
MRCIPAAELAQFLAFLADRGVNEVMRATCRATLRHP